MASYRLFRRFANWVEGEEVYPIPEIEKNGSSVREHPITEDMARVRSSDEGVGTLLRRWMDSPQGVAAFRRVYTVTAALLCAAIVTLLLVTVSYLPRFGAPDNPANNEVPRRYIEQGLSETGAVNVVAGMILDYRAFDTLGESNVLFAATVAVLILLRDDGEGKKKKRAIPELKQEPERERPDPILRASAAVVGPFALLYGVYVILNGHLSAGGGFSGGAILGAALMLLSAAFGQEKLERVFTARRCKALTFLALMCYALLKSWSFYTGANHLPSGIPLGAPGSILSGGLILPLNICVGLVVGCTMYSFYACFRSGGMRDGT